MPKYVLSFETGTRGSGGAPEEGPGETGVRGSLGRSIDLVVEPGQVFARYDATPDLARDRGFELVRVLRGALGFHFGQPVEATNVTIQGEDGSTVDTMSGRPYRVGWADVRPEELDGAVAFMRHLDPDGPYALALEYYNQGRLLLRRTLGMPEAPIIFFYKVLEVLLGRPKQNAVERHRRWRAAGFQTDDIPKLDQLRIWRNEFDAAHPPRGPHRVRMSQAHEAEEIAQMILERCASVFGVPVPAAPPRRVTVRAGS
jgi:hypothetical protein